MQDRYAGDVGDFGKLALLRALSPDRKLGVCWYLCTGEGEANNDGAHVKYLEQPDRFRALAPDVFDALGKVVNAKRSVAALESSGLLTAVFHRTPVPRGSARGAWFTELSKAVDGCDLVFADPDNGIADKVTPKHIGFDEIRALRRDGRALLVYHHQTRLKGGARDEARDLARHEVVLVALLFPARRRRRPPWQAARVRAEVERRGRADQRHGAGRCSSALRGGRAPQRLRPCAGESATSRRPELRRRTRPGRRTTS
jgi:hypothetical protein